MAGSCDNINKPLGSIKCGEFIDKLGTINFSRTLLVGVH
jgi:hypothetical protein